MDKKLDRKLAAILYADVAGYSRLTGDDEEGTHHRLSHSLDLITEAIKSYDGNVVHYAGDASRRPAQGRFYGVNMEERQPTIYDGLYGARSGKRQIDVFLI